MGKVADISHEALYPLHGRRFTLDVCEKAYPESFRIIDSPPACIFGIGNPDAVKEGIAIVGARKATPYGIACAKRFSRIASEKGIPVISGGAYGCDSASHEACMNAHGVTVAILGGGCDQPYPKRHIPLFQRIIDSGGAVISEHHWTAPPLPSGFVRRNRLIAGLAKAVLIVEAGLPSGTFSTADAALRYGKEVFVVPGAITSPNSMGCNKLLLQGAIPIIDDESFQDALFAVFGALKYPQGGACEQLTGINNETAEFNALFLPVLQALKASPYRVEQLLEMTKEGAFGKLSFKDVIEGLQRGSELGLLVKNEGGAYSYRVRD